MKTKGWSRLLPRRFLVIGLMMMPVFETGIKNRLMLSLVGYILQGMWGVEIKVQVES